jgi:glycosyltransferase involved in cell wall biosynthesis
MRPLSIGINALLMESASGYKKAGISRYASWLIEHLIGIESPHRFEVYIAPFFEVPESWHSPNFTFRRVKKRLTGWRLYFGYLKAPRIARKSGLDVWFSTSHHAPLLGSVPRVTMIHDVFPILYPELYKPLEGMFERVAMRRAVKDSEHIIVNSVATKQDLQDNFSRLPPITPIHLGPGNRLAPQRLGQRREAELERLGIPFERFFFFLGTLEPRKNLPGLFDGFALAAQRGLPPDIGIVVAGARGWREAPIFARMKQLGLENRIHFTGYVPDEDLPILFAACEFFVFPSLHEGFGIPVLEAMMMETPVLASRRPAMEEVAGEAAAFFDPSSPDDIARVLLESAALDREEMARKGAERAKKFSWDRTATETVRVFEDVAGGRQLGS